MKGDEIHIGNGRTVVVQKISLYIMMRRKEPVCPFAGRMGSFLYKDGGGRATTDSGGGRSACCYGVDYEIVLMNLK